jgi:hypothetical protein
VARVPFARVASDERHAALLSARSAPSSAARQKY